MSEGYRFLSDAVEKAMKKAARELRDRAVADGLAQALVVEARAARRQSPTEPVSEDDR